MEEADSAGDVGQIPELPVDKQLFLSILCIYESRICHFENGECDGEENTSTDARPGRPGGIVCHDDERSSLVWLRQLHHRSVG